MKTTIFLAILGGTLLTASLLSYGDDINNSAENTSPPSSQSTNLKQGQFIDTPVQGLKYVSRNQSGITDTNGMFSYEDGTTVKFFIGNILLGEGQGKSVMSPIDLVPGAADINNPTVVNIARFLQTLDDNANLADGIQITNVQSSLAAAGKSVNFNQDATAFENDGNVQTIISTLTSATTTGAKNLISSSAAQYNLQNGLTGGNQPPVNPTSTSSPVGSILTGTPSLSTTGTCGVNWQRANPVPSSIFTINSIAYGGGQFVATAGYPGGFLTSPDGVTWTWRTLVGTQIYNDITWSGNQFVAVGQFGRIRTSPDGVTWTVRNSGTTLDLYGITWNGSQFVVVVGSHLVLTSPNGVTWTMHVALGNELRSVAWGNNRFVAVGKAGTILVSPNGVNWTWLTPRTTRDLYDVIWSGNQFVAVGSGSLDSSLGIPAIILTSRDGLTWTQRTSGTTRDLKSVSWSGNQFVAVGLGGTILTSSDGVIWTQRNSGTTNGLYGVTWGRNQFVAVGGPSIILTSRCGG